MHRKARILPSAMLLACLVILAEMRSFAIEEGPALTKASAAAEEGGEDHPILSLG